MDYPKEFRYTEDHEWAKLDGNIATIGITDHAQSSLGDIVFVELPEVGRTLTQGEAFGVVESIKAVSDLYCPLDGTVIEVNSAITDNPSDLNSDPHGQAWIAKIELSDAKSFESLMDANAYSEYVKTL